VSPSTAQVLIFSAQTGAKVSNEKRKAPAGWTQSRENNQRQSERDPRWLHLRLNHDSPPRRRRRRLTSRRTSFSLQFGARIRVERRQLSPPFSLLSCQGPWPLESTNHEHQSVRDGVTRVRCVRCAPDSALVGCSASVGHSQTLDRHHGLASARRRPQKN